MSIVNFGVRHMTFIDKNANITLELNVYQLNCLLELPAQNVLAPPKIIAELWMIFFFVYIQICACHV